MKIKERCKKIGLGILGAIMTFTNKVLASVLLIEPEPMYAPKYVLPEPTIWEKLFKIAMKFSAFILIPIVLIIGIVVYVVKNKDNSEKKKER